MKALALVAAIGGMAHADSVNLLQAVPGVAIAVSSTVENPSIVPAHLVDGKLDTAWNSHTGELVGAWIAVRLPDDAKVEAIKLSVGFAKVDPKWGDLFTMNPRIKKVRITNSGQHRQFDQELDPKVRALQTIVVPNDNGGGGGGVWRIEVLEVVPGTRKDWQEINVGELEVWGTAKAAGAKKLVPAVHVGNFDHDDLTRLACMAALGVTGKVASYTTEDFTGDLSVCRIDVATAPTVVEGEKHEAGVVTIGIVKRGAKPVRVAKLPPFATEATTILDGPPMGGPPETHTTIAYRIVPLTATESALEVTTRAMSQSTGASGDDNTVQLFRIGNGGSAPKVLEFTFSAGGTLNGGDTTHCALVDPTPEAKLPARLDVRCEIHHERYGGNGPEDQSNDKVRIDHYKWNGTVFVDTSP